MNAKLANLFQFGDKETAGWYVRAAWMDTGNEENGTKVQYRVGPFTTQRDANAFNILNHAGVSDFKHYMGVEFLEQRTVDYYADDAAEQRGVKECRMVTPDECRLNRKMMGGMKVNAESVRICKGG